MDTKTSTRHRRWTPVALLLALLLVAVLPASAAYRVQRPITDDGGRLNQSYLYGEVFGTSTHKGVDLSYGLGTDVYAIADGTVVDLYEDYDNGDDSDPLGWGNRVLIRHSRRHWDRTTQQWAYVYSIYAHLSKNSVRYSIGQFVYAGTWIAEVDDTGYSSGHHLHLQICIHPQSDRTIANLNSSATSRNPELWLQAFNYGGTNTGTVVGKVTDSNGQPIGDRYIWGLDKPQGSSGTTYHWSRTYAYSWANPDDILVENWGTTDVLPGFYHLFVKNESGTYTYADLGWHTVEAGKTTYVGLYPIYLPDIMENYDGWNSSIVIHNNSNSETAQVNTTFFKYDGAWIHGQKTDYLSPKSSVMVDFPDYCYYCRGSAIVSASQDVSVLVKDQRVDGITIYNGIKASGGALGWEQAGTTLYAPVIKNNFYGRSSELVVFNAGNATAQVSVTYYRKDWEQYMGTDTVSIPPHARHTFTSGAYCAAGNSYYCAAVIDSVNGQPLAVTVHESSVGGSASTTHNVFAAANPTNYVPLVKNSYYGQTSGLGVYNTGNATTYATVTYYDSQDNDTYVVGQNIPAHAAWSFHAPDGLPTNFVGSAVVSADQPLVTAMYESGSGYYKATDAFLGGGTTLYVTLLDTRPGYGSGIAMQNVGDRAATVMVYYTDGGGGNQGNRGPYFLDPGETQILSNWNGGIPTNFLGSGRIVATNGVLLAATVNYSAPGSGDTHATYNASQP